MRAGQDAADGSVLHVSVSGAGDPELFILAPNLTIYNKLIQDFSPGTPKYVFQGIADFVQQSPRIETGDTYQQRGGLPVYRLRRQGTHSTLP